MTARASRRSSRMRRQMAETGWGPQPVFHRYALRLGQTAQSGSGEAVAAGRGHQAGGVGTEAAYPRSSNPRTPRYAAPRGQPVTAARSRRFRKGMDASARSSSLSLGDRTHASVSPAPPFRWLVCRQRSGSCAAGC